MHNNTKSRSLQRLDSAQGKWVTYQLKLRGITHANIAEAAHCSRPVVSNALAGRTSSSKVYTVLCDILGCETICELLEKNQ